MVTQAEFAINVLRNNVPIEGVKIDYKVETDPGYREVKIWDEGTLSLNDKTSKAQGTEIQGTRILALYH